MGGCTVHSFAGIGLGNQVNNSATEYKTSYSTMLFYVMKEEWLATVTPDAVVCRDGSCATVG